MLVNRSPLRENHIAYFEARVNKTEGCWPWTGSENGRGYGYFFHDGVRSVAHRVSYVLYVGEIPDGLVLDHICRNRRCVNPEHLRAVTMKVNVLENSVSPIAINSQKTHCVRGHEFTAENTKVIVRRDNKTKWRECKVCKRMFNKYQYQKERRLLKQRKSS